MKEPKYTGKISDEKLDELKKEHKNVFVLEVPANDDWSEIAVAYLKPIDRTFMSAILATKDKVKQKEMMLNELWLEGDKRIKEDDEMFYSSMTVLDDLISFRKAIIKKN